MLLEPKCLSQARLIIVEQSGKRVKIFIGLKKTCLGVLDRIERDSGNETSLKEIGVIEMSTTVLHSRAAPSLLI